VCAAVSPYRAARDHCRSLFGEGRFLEVFVDTPLEVCEQRDTKGLYAKARRGELPEFTGVSDPYERPVAPELTITTTDAAPEENARRILALAGERGFVAT